jgi:hypothetical protein
MSRTRKLAVLGVVVIVLGALFWVSTLNIKTVHAQSGQSTIYVSQDTYVDSSNPNSNYGGLLWFITENYQQTSLGQTANYKTIVWLKFNLTSVPDGAVVDNATLQIFADYVSTNEIFNVHAYSCSNISWTELGITYTNMPSYNITSMDTKVIKGATDNNYYIPQWYSWDVIDAVKNAQESGSNAVTIVLADPSSSHNDSSIIRWVARETNNIPHGTGNVGPVLIVHWSSTVPEFPTFLILPFFMIATLLAVMVYKKKAMPYRRL